LLNVQNGPFSPPPHSQKAEVEPDSSVLGAFTVLAMPELGHIRRDLEVPEELSSMRLAVSTSRTGATPAERIVMERHSAKLSPAWETDEVVERPLDS
jgi:hypothetical protein